ncbi:MAG: DUF3786 domain-containing protein, partial [Deltaproteobacteria bacterium]|nr:DUF3786 domain-containing protein [Deltaproteobacteria bacterium]
MADRIDNSYFVELAEQNPADICRRAGCSYDTDNRSYRIDLWVNEYEVDPAQCPAQCRVTGINDDFTPPHEYFDLFIIYYLLRAKELRLNGEWISEKDIPGGSGFFRGPHDIPTEMICNRFHNDIGAFKKRCEQLHGTAIDMGDAAFTFRIAPRIPVTVLYWTGDEDFSPEA